MRIPLMPFHERGKGRSGDPEYRHVSSAGYSESAKAAGFRSIPSVLSQEDFDRSRQPQGVYACVPLRNEGHPDSVIQASGAAPRPLPRSGARGTLIRKKEYPPERELTPDRSPASEPSSAVAGRISQELLM